MSKHKKAHKPQKISKAAVKRNDSFYTDEEIKAMKEPGDLDLEKIQYIKRYILHLDQMLTTKVITKKRYESELNKIGDEVCKLEEKYLSVNAVA